MLRALDYLAEAGAEPDERCDDAIEVVRRKQRKDGTWPLQGGHPGKEHFAMESSGKPSRWNTLRALRVLDWYERSPKQPGEIRSAQAERHQTLDE